jgi:hypothetical protein
MTKKERNVSFRIKKYLYDFLNDYTKDKPYDKTDIMTKLIENFYLDTLKGNNTEKMMTNEVIFIVVEERMKNFLEIVAKDCKCNTREMVKNIIEYFFMGWLSSTLTLSYSDMKQKFDEKYGSEKRVQTFGEN